MNKHPGKRAWGSIPPLPNEGSTHQTPASLMADVHFANLHLMQRWDWDRYARFCQFLGMTAYEVASLVTMKHKAVDDFRVKNHLTCYNGQAIALLLTIFEAWACKNWTNDVIANPFPSMNSTQTSTPSDASGSQPLASTQPLNGF